MNTSKTATSRWVLAYALVMLLISVNTAVLGYLAPELLFGESLESARSAAVTHFYATRNLSVAVLGLVALLSRARPLLFAFVLVRLVIDSVDLGFTLQHGLVDAPAPLLIVGWLLFFTLPQLASLWHLREGRLGPGWQFDFEETVLVQAPPAQAWAKLSRHESMPQWVKLGLRWVRVEPDQGAAVGAAGSLRIIRFAGWPPVTERFIEVQKRRYTYAVIQGMPHLQEHLGELQVERQDQGSLVRWSIRFVFDPLHPLSWGAPLFVAGFRHVVRSGLVELKGQLESQKGSPAP